MKYRRHARTPSSPSSRRRRCRASAPSAASSCRSRTAPTSATPRSTRAMKDVQAKAREDAGARRRLLQLQHRRAAALRRSRPHQGAAARRRCAGRLRHDADLSRLALCQRLQPLRPHLPGHRAGRHAVPLQARRHPAACKTRNADGQMVPLGAMVQRQRHDRARTAPCATTASAPPISTARRRPAIPPARRRPRSRSSCTRTLPKGMSFEWTDLTYQQILAGNTALLVFPLCVLLVFLVLAAQVRKPVPAARDHPDRADVPALAPSPASG